MDRQVEKLKLIEWLIGLQDAAVLYRLEELRRNSEQSSNKESLKPMSIEELKTRALESSRAIANAQVSDIEDILQEGSQV